MTNQDKVVAAAGSAAGMGVCFRVVLGWIFPSPDYGFVLTFLAAGVFAAVFICAAIVFFAAEDVIKGGNPIKRLGKWLQNIGEQPDKNDGTQKEMNNDQSNTPK